MAGSPCPVKVMQDVVDKNERDGTDNCVRRLSSQGCTQSRTDDSVELRVNTVGLLCPALMQIVDVRPADLASQC